MRLGDSLLLSTIEKRVLSPVRNEWGNLISIKNFGSALNPITDEYILKASNQGGLYKGEKGVVNYWMATIGHKDWPSNVFIYVEIADIDEKLGDINPFLNQVPNLVDSLLSVKWLSEYIKTHPNIEVKIQFCDEISMNDESMDLFWKDMFDFRKESIRELVKENRNEVIYAQIRERTKRSSNSSRWIILPDDHVLLWSFEGDQVLKWKAEDIKTLDNYRMHIAGVLITPEGNFQ